MKAKKLLITLGAFLTAFLVGGVALANDPSGLDSVSSDSTLAAPNLTVTITGNKVSLSWTKVDGATDYKVHYAQYPYDNPDTIKTIDAGDKKAASFNILAGSAYHVAVKACDASGFDCSAYSRIHKVVIPLDSTFKNHLGQEFKLIPEGTFTMGSPTSEPGRGMPWIEGNPNAETQHQVTLTQSFYMQTTEVTQGQWKKVMGNNPSGIEYHCGDDCPVDQISWDDAQSFIKKLNELEKTDKYRLPTEAEWEYACRAGSTTAFYNGHITKPNGVDPNLDKIGWYDKNESDTMMSPVAQKTANAWGLYDMSGNAQEWCQDWLDPYPSGPVIDPKGPSSSSVGSRVLRGGGYPFPAGYARSAARYGSMQDYPMLTEGLRLVREP